LLDRVTPY